MVKERDLVGAMGHPFHSTIGFPVISSLVVSRVTALKFYLKYALNPEQYIGMTLSFNENGYLKKKDYDVFTSR